MSKRGILKIVLGLACFCSLPLAQAGEWAAALGNSTQWLQTLRGWQQENKLPGLALDGVVLPQKLLLDSLAQQLNDDKMTVQDLQLSPQGGRIIILAHKALEVQLTVQFQIVGVDWEHRLVYLDYQEQTQTLSHSALGDLFSTLLLRAFEGATAAKHVQAATEKLPYFKINGQRITVDLAKIPQLTAQLDPIKGNAVFNYVGIKRLETEQGQLRVRLGRMR